MLVRELSDIHNVVGTVREAGGNNIPLLHFLDRDQIRFAISAENDSQIAELLTTEKPDVVLNCIGVVKQLQESKDPKSSEGANSKLPHLLSEICQKIGARLIHFSTDCVFSGRTGNYKETEIPDPIDVYGRTKFLGELSNDRDLTLRTSFVGRELVHFSNLFEWARRQQNKEISGFRQAIYSGLTTKSLARIVRSLISDHLSLTGLFHIASKPISKYDLLCILNSKLKLNLSITPDDAFISDRSLDGTRFLLTTGIEIPSWDQMLDEFVSDEMTYKQLGFR